MQRQLFARLGPVVLGTCLLFAFCACSALPADWPIKELTLPPASTAGAVPRRAKDLREMLNRVQEVQDRIPLAPKWQVGFNNKGSWESIVSSVGGQLAALGFTEWKPSNLRDVDAQVGGLSGGQKFVDVIRIYESADKKLVVNLMNTSQMTTSGSQIDKEGDYILAIGARP